MSRLQRTLLCGAILSTGLAAQAGLERLNQTVRPRLRHPLASIPLDLGDWVGKDEPVDADIVDRAQTTEYLNRTYESRKQPGLRLRLWINFSLQGTNLRHTPENLPALRRLDQDRVADSRARRAARLGPIDRCHETGLPAR